MVLIIGDGRSGRSANNLLCKHGYETIIFDDKKHLVTNFESIVKKCEFVVVSPAVDMLHPLVILARFLGKEIFGEIELAYKYHYKDSKIIAVTGTNGKTTTTSLIGHILGEQGYTAGNIGLPWSDSCSLEKTACLEISSFQLETIQGFRANIALFLNFAPDHLIRHGNLDEYKRCKCRIFENQTYEDFAIIFDELEMKEELKNIKSKVYYFGFKKHNNGAYLDGKDIVFSDNGKVERVCSLDSIPLFGKHNILNVLASVCACKLFGMSAAEIESRIKTFVSPRHRMEKVGEFSDILFINDSKATNVHACINALKCFEKNVVLVLGGSDKGEDFSSIFENYKIIKKAIIVGETSDKIVRSAIENGFNDFIVLDNPKSAIIKAIEVAQKGDIVLFSPACASFDFFKNYEERGDFFVSQVKEYFKVN